MRPTILYFTYRPGGYDLLADGLKHQTHQDYELVIVDDYIDPKTGTSRKKIVDTYLNENGVYPAYNGPSKKKCFPELAFNSLNAMNTGFLMSTGDPIIILTDYIWMNPNALERFCAYEQKYKEKTCITSIGRMWDKDPSDLTDPISVWSPKWEGSPIKNSAIYRYTWAPEKFEMSFSAIPWSVLEDTNGYPECYDNLSCYTSQEILDDAFFFHERFGAKYFVAHDIVCEMINHRNWQPFRLWHVAKQAPLSGLSTTYVKRENTFNLRTHKRGTLP